MKNFFVKISSCAETEFEIVIQKLLDMEINIKSFQVIGGGMFSGLVGYVLCEGEITYEKERELESHCYNHVPGYRLHDIEKYKGTDKYEKKLKDSAEPVYIEIIKKEDSGNEV